jgi:MFS family permease
VAEQKSAPRALANPNLRLYFAGQVVSMIGTWMQQMALSWLIYRLTDSTFMLGLVAFASQAPTFLLTPFAGIVADRVNRKKLVIITQSLAMLQAAILAALAFSEKPVIWHLIALGAFSGLINAFDLPTRQTFLVDMLESRDELPNAIAVNSSITTLTRLIGPSIAGLFIAWAGEAMCFVVNAVSYVAVIVALVFVKAKQKPLSGDRPGAIVQLKEGFKYAFSFSPIRVLLAMIASVSLFVMPYSVLMPAFARDVFHGSATTLGVLTAASGLGSLTGALYLSTRKGVLGLGRWIVISCAMFGLGLIAFGFSNSLWVALPVLTVVGFGGMILMAGSNTILQTLVDEDKRGRVMSIYTMCFMGLAPFGSMAAGALSTRIGLAPTVIASGIIGVILALGFASRLRKIRQDARPIYIERGILDAEAELKVLNS